MLSRFTLNNSPGTPKTSRIEIPVLALAGTNAVDGDVGGGLLGSEPIAYVAVEAIQLGSVSRFIVVLL